MKRFLTLIFLLALLARCDSQTLLTNILNGNVSNFGDSARTNLTVTLELLFPKNRFIGGQFISNDQITNGTDTNGNFGFTNIQWGVYRFTLSDSSGSAWYPQVGTNVSGTWLLSALCTPSGAIPPNPATNYFTQAQTLALLASSGSGNTNALTPTQNALLTNAVQANLSGVVTNTGPTNATSFTVAGTNQINALAAAQVTGANLTGTLTNNTTGSAATATTATNVPGLTVNNTNVNEIWISPVGTDGTGNGTPVSPYVCTTASSFDGLLTKGVLPQNWIIPPTNSLIPINTTIHLMAGTFHDTNGIIMQTGWRLIGAGRMETVIKRDPQTNAWFNNDVIGGQSDYFPCGRSNMMVENLTVDLNHQNELIPGNYVAVTLTGDNALIKDCRAINYGCAITNGEEGGLFSILAYGGNFYGTVLSNICHNAVIDGCSLGNSANMFNAPNTGIDGFNIGGFGFFGNTSNSSSISLEFPATLSITNGWVVGGEIKNCYLEYPITNQPTANGGIGMPAYFHAIGGFSTFVQSIKIHNNFIANIYAGYSSDSTAIYGEAGPNNGIQVYNNTLFNVANGIANRNAAYLRNNVSIHDNFIRYNGGYESAGINISGNAVLTNYFNYLTIQNNDVAALNPNPTNQQTLALSVNYATNLVVQNNYLDNGGTNDVLVYTNNYLLKWFNNWNGWGTNPVFNVSLPSLGFTSYPNKLIADQVVAAFTGNGSGLTNYSAVNMTTNGANPAPAQGQVLAVQAGGGIGWTNPASGGSGITALTSDVTASGSGSVAATVVAVGGVTAANVASGATAANAATTADTGSTIVMRNASGNFQAGTITATFSGNGSALMALNASQVTSGTVPVAQLPVMVVGVNGIGQPDGTTLAINSGVLSVQHLPTGLTITNAVVTNSFFYGQGALSGLTNTGTFYNSGALTNGGNFSVTGTALVVGGFTNLALTASKPVFTDGNDGFTSTGTVPLGDIPAGVALTGSANTFTVGQTLNGGFTNTAANIYNAGNFTNGGTANLASLYVQGIHTNVGPILAQGNITNSVLTASAPVFTDANKALTSTGTLPASDLSGTLQAVQFPALTGDITTTAGALATALKATGTAGTYIKTTFDSNGRETSGTTLGLGDLPAGVLTNNAVGTINLATNGTLTVSNLVITGLGSGNGGGFTNLNANSFSNGIAYTGTNTSKAIVPTGLDSTGTNLVSSSLFAGSTTNQGSFTATNGFASYAQHIPTAVTVGGSPFSYTNVSPVAQECYFDGTVSAYAVAKNGVTVYGSLVGADYFVLQPTNVCTITWSVNAPTFYTNSW